MGRLPRVYIEGVLYYVSSRSGHGQNLFVDTSDYQQYISLLNKYKQQYGFKLFTYVLLPTHLHILVELRNNVPISNIMHDINSLYTKIFNSRYNKKGHLFQERFRTTLAEKETYLLPLMRHIHLNPQRAKFVYAPGDYPYSSYSQFLNSEKRQFPDMREEIEEIFTILKGTEEAFAKYVSSPDQKEIGEFRKSLRKKRVLGSREFVERIKKIIAEESAKTQEKRRQLSKKARIIYVTVAGTIVFLAAITIDYFYRSQSLKLRSKYEKSLVLYQRTLDVLKEERDEALKAEKDTESYQWKIKLTERALEELKAERSKALKAEKEGIDGYAWEIKLTQFGGPKGPFANTDVISLNDGRLNSENLTDEGFTNPRYSKRQLEEDKVVWETIQTNPQGETVSWRGEWNGQRMKGVISRRSAQGVMRDFSFVSTSERMRK